MPPFLRSLDRCFEEGTKARADGLTVTDNPYCRDSDEGREWCAGWRATFDLDEDADPSSDRLHRQDDAYVS